ncbi:hypothetical protein PV08_02720 [Exophiala spinifera]|uniref:Major facilitator superfamily (MFS) profile domain-containing protein n=1 Tax=Exophiala spinifera TaxID=91928 RepID=A0A0D2A0B7_9EURO|nr:uncharacterized protein PV08_02720 [Exophiala spinifera]KIW18432.1 hypothetical protein PV08_02720 [Exophiala spinifera]
MAGSFDNRDLDFQSWPPGTIQIEDLCGGRYDKIILHPAPSTDPNDPLNWSKPRKSLNFGLTCYYTLMVFVLVAISTVIYGPLMTEFGFDIEVLNEGFGANTAGLAVGCVLFIPLALKFGRRPVYLVSFTMSLATAIWQARLRTAGDVYGANVVSGLGGSVAQTICQMTISDLFYVHQRATANGAYIAIVTTGTFLGPVAAGYITDSQGWRWIWWWTAIFLGVGLVAFIFFYEETKYIPLIDAHGPPSARDSASNFAVSAASAGDEGTPVLRHAEEAREGDKDLESGVQKCDTEAPTVVMTRTVVREVKLTPYSQRLRLLTVTPGGFKDLIRHTWQPFVVLFTTPAVAYTSLINGSLLAWVTVLLSVFSTYLTLPPYNFSTSAVGLMNVAPFIGSFLGSAYGGVLSDFHIIRLSQKNNGIYEPEMRFWLALPWLVITPLSLLMFGLCLTHSLPWISLAIALVIFGAGLNVFNAIALTYLIDSYRNIVGDSLVAVTFVGDALASAVAMSLSPWIKGTGLNTVFVICTVVSTVVFLTTIPMMIWGKAFRARTAKRYAMMAQRQFNANR